MFSDYFFGQQLDPPQLVEIEPTLGCNLRCLMCHVPHMKQKTQMIDVETLDRQTSTLHDCHVIIGSQFEPTIHPEFDKILRLAIKRRWKLDFLTNATNLHRYDAALLADVEFHVFSVSFDGSTKESFEFTRCGADYEKTLENTLRGAEIARKTGAYTAISATVTRANVEETPDMIRKWEGFGFDLVRLSLAQVRALKEELFAQSLYPIMERTKTILNDVAHMIAHEHLRIGAQCAYYGNPTFKIPAGASVNDATVSSDNPLRREVRRVRQEFQYGDWPGMPIPCRSPFVYCRIRWDGGVDLCSKGDFLIGNINERSFEKIWNGRRARAIRNALKVRDNPTCKSCDYFRLCIGYGHFDVETPQVHFPAGLIDHPKTKEW